MSIPRKARPRPVGLQGLCSLLLLLAVGLPVHAQQTPAPAPVAADPASQAGQEPAGATQSFVPAERKSPRATMLSFLAAMNDVARGRDEALDDALACLDLSELNPVIRRDTGVAAAVQLKEALDRLQFVDPQAVPGAADSPPFTVVSRREGRVHLVRGDDAQWRFDAATVAAAPLLYDAVKDLPRLAGRPIAVGRFVASQRLRSWMPESLQQVGLLLEHWQWLALGLLTFLGVLLDRISIWLLGALAMLVLRWRGLPVGDRSPLRRHLRPLGLLAMSGLWIGGLPWLGLPGDAHAWLLIAARSVFAAAAVWGAYRLVDVLGDALTTWAERTDSALDDLLVPLVVKSLKIFVAAMGLVFLADQLELEITPLLTGLGLGGLAFALAAKDMLGNLFGSVMVIADRTFQVGDWIVVGDVEGTVEQVGFRSTRIRTFYNSLISLPNSQLVTTSVDNFGRRRFRRWKASLSLTYDTPPERIEAFCEGLRELVKRHPYTRKDYYHVYLNGFAASSLDVLLYVFFETPDWGTELRERQRLMLDILRLARRLGVSFAFPTQTLHVARDDESGQPEVESETQRNVSQATMRGRQQAREIALAFGLDTGTKPPPVRIEATGDVNPGGEGEGG